MCVLVPPLLTSKHFCPLYMGNMSNPCINRWGLNTFWHNFWYADFNYSYNQKQDKIFSTLIQIFLFNGVNLTYNLFANQYWYSKNYSQLSTKSYQRWITRKPNQFGEIMRYSLRQEADCVFPMKIWILKYSHWVVINQYWFQPLKKKRQRGIKESPKHLDALNSAAPNQFGQLRTFKTLLSKTLLTQLLHREYYKF